MANQFNHEDREGAKAAKKNKIQNDFLRALRAFAIFVISFKGEVAAALPFHPPASYNLPVPLHDDDTVCFCFHVTKRKVESFCRQSKPQVASQISQCLSAGTGCGWCVPMLKKIHKEICGDKRPWWREVETETVGEVDSESWSAGRQQYIAEGKGKPPERDSTTRE